MTTNSNEGTRDFMSGIDRVIFRWLAAKFQLWYSKTWFGTVIRMFRFLPIVLNSFLLAFLIGAGIAYKSMPEAVFDWKIFYWDWVVVVYVEPLSYLSTILLLFTRADKWLKIISIAVMLARLFAYIQFGDWLQYP